MSKKPSGGAYHEAGHAVIARLEGIAIYSVSIIPTIVPNERALGTITWTDTRREEWLTNNQVAKIRALFAGGIAQERAGFVVGVGDFGDRLDIEHLAKLRILRLKPGEALDEYFDEDGDLWLSVDEEIRASTLMKRLQKQTKALVTRHWLSIERVAKALQRRRTLYQSDVDTLMEGRQQTAANRKRRRMRASPSAEPIS